MFSNLSDGSLTIETNASEKPIIQTYPYYTVDPIKINTNLGLSSKTKENFLKRQLMVISYNAVHNLCLAKYKKDYNALRRSMKNISGVSDRRKRLIQFFANLKYKLLHEFRNKLTNKNLSENEIEARVDIFHKDNDTSFKYFIMLILEIDTLDLSLPENNEIQQFEPLCPN